jgi:hypothetical protein
VLLDGGDLMAELRTLLARRRGGDDQALTALIARMIELTTLVQKQGEKIRELEQRLDLRSR